MPTLRLAVQAAALILTVLGYFLLVRNFGLPHWAFFLTVVAFGMFFCGWVCPFGTVQEWFRAVGRKLFGITYRLPVRAARYLAFSRYIVVVLGGAFAWSALEARRTFISATMGEVAETAAYAVLGVLLALSLFVDRPYCRFLCGFGAVAGLASMARLFGIKRDGGKCTGCGRCDTACMMGVEVSRAHNVRDPNCINCGKCLAACRVDGALRTGLTIPCKADAAALKDKYLERGENAKRPTAL